MPCCCAEGDNFSSGGPPIFDGIDEAAAGQLAAAAVVGTHSWEDLQVPTVAHIQGQCFDGAFEQCLACDLIWAAGGAQISQIETAVGGFPWVDVTQRLASPRGSALPAPPKWYSPPPSCPPRRSTRGAPSTASPHPPGFSTRAAPSQGLAAGPTPVCKAIKRIVHAWRSGGVHEADRISIAEAPAVMLSEDFKDGIESLKQHGLGYAIFHGR